MQLDLTRGSVTKSMLLFAGPMILGNLLQQFYNVADTLIVGQFLGSGALAAVGSSFALMTFLTSILLGVCMGSGIVFSMLFGACREEELKNSVFISFVLSGILAIIIEISVLLLLSPIMKLLQIPHSIWLETQTYLRIIFCGIIFVYLYNFFASLLRSIGNSVTPLVFLGISAVLNIVLDLLFIITFQMGVAGAAWATIIAQGISAVCMILYCMKKIPLLRMNRTNLHFSSGAVHQIIQYSLLTCVQQSIMNLGILMVQGLVNSFGVSVMAAFAAAVKIDSFAYMPVQDFGNAFSTFIAQNQGAQKKERIHHGIFSAAITSLIFCIFISTVVFLFASRLMLIFVNPSETEIIAIGAKYLQIEGACYCGIGTLFLLYGLYRGLGLPGISVILTVISLGTRVCLAYLLAPIPSIGLIGIWWAIPIGWVLADFTGILYYWFIIKK